MYTYSDSTIMSDFGFIVIFHAKFPQSSHVFYAARRPKTLVPRMTETYMYLILVFFHISLGSSSLGTALPEPSNSRLHQCLSGLSQNTVFNTLIK